MQSATRYAFRNAATSSTGLVRSSPLAGTAAWICAECRLKSYRRGLAGLAIPRKRQFSNALRRRQEGTPSEAKLPEAPTKPSSRTSDLLSATAASTSSALPSHAEHRRWQMSRDMTKMVDGILARASVAGQHINQYTGTDYSGIETLRKGIIDQEQSARDRHQAVEDAKTSHHDAYVRQAVAQKEIVSLLERKSSWSPSDLERYMTLVRSEHVNDQAVQAAKDSLAAAERELEETRSLLERLERKQYHEEQIWSDTIRRNSTWVTFGLMGVNIVLLLANILIFEPYRRRKIVRDMKVALDEKMVAAPASPSLSQELTVAIAPRPDAGNAVSLVEPIEQAEQPLDPLLEPLIAELQEADQLPTPAETLQSSVIVASQRQVSDALGTSASTFSSSWEAYTEKFYDLFSERMVQLKQSEVTAVALQGAATGVAVMGILFVALRPK